MANKLTTPRKLATWWSRGERFDSAEADELVALRGQLAALDRSHAVIQFDLKGTILTANDNFLRLFGYRLDELQGQNHSVLVDATHRVSDAYGRFWDELRRGQSQTGQYKHLFKGGRDALLQASYNPVLDSEGKPYKILALA